MRTILISTVILFCFVSHFRAQGTKEIKNNQVEGFYLTIEDYRQGKLTRPIDKLHKGDKIKLKQFFFSPDIASFEQGKKTVYYKDSIFAIRLSNGENFRFINHKPCLIVDTTYLYIYAYNTVKTEYKQSGATTRRKEIAVTNYYFSTYRHKNAYALTLINLRKYALDNNAVHLAVCNRFTTDEMLWQVNDKTGQFKLNEVILNVVVH